MSKMKKGNKAVRYAVVGLGYISQVAVLPAFAHARKNSRLVALVSDDPAKLQQLGRKYGVDALFTYERYDDCIQSGQVDAVYIALPNDMHREYTERAAKAGVHVLCEKPMAVTENDCRSMMQAAGQSDVRLMIAYRLHFEQANLRAAEIAASGKLGDVRSFNSTFTMQVQKGNIRLQRERGGGTLYDIGIYCINAARYLFKDEPVEGVAWAAAADQKRFEEVEEMTSVILRFPGERLASFICSFGAADISRYEVIGTKGSLAVEQAYEFSSDIRHRLTIGSRASERTFSKRDQFAPELIAFSQSVMDHKEPEPSGIEGLIDVHIIERLYESVRTGRPVTFELPRRSERPTIRQAIRRPPVRKPALVHAAPPHAS